MNFTYKETTSIQNSKGSKSVDCFRYEMDEKMWKNTPDNVKYHQTSGNPEYLLELTSIAGLPLYFSKPYMNGVDSKLLAHLDFKGVDHSLPNRSYIDVEPLLGVPINVDLNFQVNFAIHNKMLDASSFYDNVTSLAESDYSGSWRSERFETTLVPFFYTKIKQKMTDDQIKDYVKVLDTVDKALTLAEEALPTVELLTIFGIIIMVLSCGCICGAGVLAKQGGGGSKVQVEKT